MVYQGPVPVGYDLEHFRKTGETREEVKIVDPKTGRTWGSVEEYVYDPKKYGGGRSGSPLRNLKEELAARQAEEIKRVAEETARRQSEQEAQKLRTERIDEEAQKLRTERIDEEAQKLRTERIDEETAKIKRPSEKIWGAYDPTSIERGIDQGFWTSLKQSIGNVFDPKTYIESEVDKKLRIASIGFGPSLITAGATQPVGYESGTIRKEKITDKIIEPFKYTGTYEGDQPAFVPDKWGGRGTTVIAPPLPGGIPSVIVGPDYTFKTTPDEPLVPTIGSVALTHVFLKEAELEGKRQSIELGVSDFGKSRQEELFKASQKRIDEGESFSLVKKEYEEQVGFLEGFLQEKYSMKMEEQGLTKEYPELSAMQADYRSLYGETGTYKAAKFRVSLAEAGAVIGASFVPPAHPYVASYLIGTALYKRALISEEMSVGAKIPFMEKIEPVTRFVGGVMFASSALRQFETSIIKEELIRHSSSDIILDQIVYQGDDVSLAVLKLTQQSGGLKTSTEVMGKVMKEGIGKVFMPSGKGVSVTTGKVSWNILNEPTGTSFFAGQTFEVGSKSLKLPSSIHPYVKILEKGGVQTFLSKSVVIPKISMGTLYGDDVLMSSKHLKRLGLNLRRSIKLGGIGEKSYGLTFLKKVSVLGKASGGVQPKEFESLSYGLGVVGGKPVLVHPTAIGNIKVIKKDFGLSGLEKMDSIDDIVKVFRGGGTKTPLSVTFGKETAQKVIIDSSKLKIALPPPTFLKKVLKESFVSVTSKTSPYYGSVYGLQGAMGPLILKKDLFSTSTYTLTSQTITPLSTQAQQIKFVAPLSLKFPQTKSSVTSISLQTITPLSTQAQQIKFVAPFPQQTQQVQSPITPIARAPFTLKYTPLFEWGVPLIPFIPPFLGIPSTKKARKTGLKDFFRTPSWASVERGIFSAKPSKYEFTGIVERPMIKKKKRKKRKK